MGVYALAGGGGSVQPHRVANIRCLLLVPTFFETNRFLIDSARLDRKPAPDTALSLPPLSYECGALPPGYLCTWVLGIQTWLSHLLSECFAK